MAHVLELQERGAAAGALGREAGYLDGYLRALVEAGIVSPKEALELVRGERARRHGAASVPVEEVTQAEPRRAVAG